MESNLFSSTETILSWLIPATIFAIVFGIVAGIALLGAREEKRGMAEPDNPPPADLPREVKLNEYTALFGMLFDQLAANLIKYLPYFKQFMPLEISMSREFIVEDETVHFQTTLLLTKEQPNDETIRTDGAGQPGDPSVEEKHDQAGQEEQAGAEVGAPGGV